ncbi:hypothetical protein RFI_10981 [Reticulomyxa filosa]|uniref:Uncharacterized protein n=1 Tax=Reticulomyxa filosa TaxID=46433 RepID=X6NJR5_RETFI|nr:hypothetical protein RFI_10981 [Reticulomyxa filosa]|eukprot:ETO26158.1 hypothetical protein RFI_10981 [Reticulomyxa filosa]
MENKTTITPTCVHSFNFDFKIFVLMEFEFLGDLLFSFPFKLLLLANDGKDSYCLSFIICSFVLLCFVVSVYGKQEGQSRGLTANYTSQTLYNFFSLPSNKGVQKTRHYICRDIYTNKSSLAVRPLYTSAHRIYMLKHQKKKKKKKKKGVAFEIGNTTQHNNNKNK